jgi:hypothetical protein
MSKYPVWDLGIDRSSVALEKFWNVELMLAKKDFSSNPSLVCGNNRTTMRAVEMTARRKIAKILGELDLNEISSKFAFGPGASTSLPRTRGDAAYKFGAKRPQLTYNAEFLAHAASRAYRSWPFEATLVAGSRLITVPKNAKTDRVICVEPDLNMFFQKGLGSVIRRRLQRWGLLLRDAQQKNAEYARIGSADGSLATVDLSSASDSIHMEVVRLLLPPDWVELIEQMRTPAVVLPDERVIPLHKVSSMGNGFTFELETLIFYALTDSVRELLGPGMDHRCTVFGDDIIVASGIVDPLRDVLAFYGFEMNPKKTFSGGPFRESCGKHYFRGTDVTPFYVRKPIDTVPRKYWAANTVKRYSRLSWGLDARWKETYNNVVATIPPSLRNRKIPDGVGNGGLVSDWDEVRPSRANGQHDSWIYTDFVPRFRYKELADLGVLLKSLHSLDLRKDPYGEDQFSSDVILTLALYGDILSEDIPVAKLVKHFEGVDVSAARLPILNGWRKHTGTVKQWPTFGPWL